MIKVLLTNVGRRTYFIKYFNDLIKLGYPLKIYLSDMSMDTASFYVNKNFKKVIFPEVSLSRKNYVKKVMTFCKKKKINLVLPLTDLDLYILAKYKNYFLKNKTTVVISNVNLIKTFHNKIAAHNFCLKKNINSPKIFNDIKFINFPVMQKKITGSGSQDLKFIKNKKFLLPLKDKNFFFQKFIKGKEYNMDILNDLKGNYLHSTTKLKLLMRAGETDKAQIVKKKIFNKLGKKLSNLIQHIGPIDVDFIMDKKKNIFFIDFNLRFGGGYPFTHEAGSNYLKAIIDNYMNKKIYIKNPKDMTGYKGIEILFR